MKADIDVAKKYAAKFNNDDWPKITATKFLSEHRGTLEAMPTVHLELKLAVTLGAATSMSQNSFLCLQKHYARSQAFNEARLQRLFCPTVFVDKKNKSVW